MIKNNQGIKVEQKLNPAYKNKRKGFALKRNAQLEITKTLPTNLILQNSRLKNQSYRIKVGLVLRSAALIIELRTLRTLNFHSDRSINAYNSHKTR